jgi:enediyne biosynthesis protein E5
MNAIADLRLKALWRFAFAITALNVVGHAWLGFEASDLQSVAAVLAAYTTESLLELARVWRTGERPRFLRGSLKERIEFFLAPHISGLAVAMLTYANDRVWPVVFGAVVAIASKALIRAPVAGKFRHVMNPSNVGISAMLLCFPWIGVAMPYQFTENLPGAWGYLIPVIVICTGSLLNAKLTGRLPLILAWLGGFVLQAAIRSVLMPEDVRLGSALNVMSGVAFILFTYYMISDPQTTPESRMGQVTFGLMTATAYGVLMVFGVVYTLFFALTVTCTVRGVWLWIAVFARQPVAIAPAPEVELVTEQV